MARYVGQSLSILYTVVAVFNNNNNLLRKIASQYTNYFHDFLFHFVELIRLNAAAINLLRVIVRQLSQIIKALQC